MTGPGIVSATARQHRRGRGAFVAFALAAAGLALVLAANAHLLYSALRSQPACVPHIREAGSGPPGSAYRPAESSC